MLPKTPLDEFIDRLQQKKSTDPALSTPRHTHTIDAISGQHHGLKCDNPPSHFVHTSQAPSSGFPANALPMRELAAAYLQYWRLSESAPLEAFRGAYREIVQRESEAEPAVAWQTLREAATAYHTETGICPFCRERGTLHLPAEQLVMELQESQ